MLKSIFPLLGQVFIKDFFPPHVPTFLFLYALIYLLGLDLPVKWFRLLILNPGYEILDKENRTLKSLEPRMV